MIILSLIRPPTPKEVIWAEPTGKFEKILSSKKHYKNKPLSAINISKTKDQNYGTSSSSIIAVPSSSTQNKIKNNLFLFNSGTPEKNNFSFIDTWMMTIDNISIKYAII